MTDDEIISSLRAGDRSAFPILYKRYATKGIGYAHALLHNSNDAEEAVQEVFCRLLQPMSRGKVDPDRGGFCAIFFKTLRNLCIDILRKQRRAKALPLEFVPEPRAPRVRESLTEADMEKKVRDALAALPAKQCDALTLKLNGNLSYDQIAEILGCTHAQVRSWIYRARRSLETRFRQEGLMQG